MENIETNMSSMLYLKNVPLLYGSNRGGRPPDDYCRRCHVITVLPMWRASLILPDISGWSISNRCTAGNQRFFWSQLICLHFCDVRGRQNWQSIVIFQIWRSSRHSRLPHRRAHYSSEQVHPDRPVWGQSSKLLPCTYSQLRLSVFSYISFM